MDAIRSSLMMDLLIQRRGVGIRDVITDVGAIVAGYFYYNIYMTYELAYYYICCNLY